MKITTRVQRMDPRTLKLLELNARFMRHETFQRLVANIKADGAVTQIPFAVKEEDGSYRVLSGNHRVQAAIEAGLEEIDVQVTDDNIPNARKLAIQLSHNAVTGEDDQTLLRQLFDAIDDVDARLYSGLDDKQMALLAEQPDLDSLSEPNLDFSTIAVTFLPDEVELLKKCLDEAAAMTKVNERFAARLKDYDRFMEAVLTAGRAAKVANIATGLLIVLEVFERHKMSLQAEWLDEDGTAKHDGAVPLSTVLGRDTIPAKGAATVAKAVKTIVQKQGLEKVQTWEAIVIMAEAFLDGQTKGA